MFPRQGTFLRPSRCFRRQLSLSREIATTSRVSSTLDNTDAWEPERRRNWTTTGRNNLWWSAAKVASFGRLLPLWPEYIHFPALRGVGAVIVASRLARP